MAEPNTDELIKKKKKRQPSTIRNVGGKALFFFSLIFCKKGFIWIFVKRQLREMILTVIIIIEY